MVEVSYLANAPIVEALIDLRVQFSPTFTPETLRALRKEFQGEFPRVEERELFEHSFGVGGKGSSLSSTELKGLHGIWFRSEDGLEILQCRIDGFTLSRLKPYKDWVDLRARAQNLWKIFARVTQPEAITRVAVRYINQIRLPELTAGLGNYITIPMPIPPSEKRTVSSMLTRVVLEDEECRAKCNLIQNLNFDIKSKEPILVLDIDVFGVRDYSPENDRVWDDLESFRGLKNHFFFSAITENLKRRFI